MNEKKYDVCEICGKMLEYSTSLENYRELSCFFCKKKFSANIFCPADHYICDKCHSKGSINIIEEFCEQTDLKDPFLIADILMQHPKFKVYGPEHHVLVPAVIITALKNNGIKKPSGEEITTLDLKEAIKRASKIPGGWCGFYGSCGAGMGSGVAMSIFTNATPAKDIPRTLANKMTSRALINIADNLEHCCKRSVRISIIQFLKFLNEEFSIDLKYNPKKCNFSSLNDKCEKSKCLFF
ncbi:MAG: DUF5714 domain-containing protein [Promethearchaeota archaeon]